MKALSSQGFGRKLLLFLALDVLLAAVAAVWNRSSIEFVGRFALGIPGSVLLAALWNATERK